jgi:radical SAM protein with 4Fe4S-binding SPASM domain
MGHDTIRGAAGASILTAELLHKKGMLQMLIIAWETTSACNLKCNYCRASATAKAAPDELSTEEAFAFIDEVAPRKPMLILSGGEPLLRPDIFLLVQHAVSHGLRVSFATNGTLLTAEMVEKVASSGVSRVSISLDGSTLEKHDASRGQGSYLQSMVGIENLRGKVDFQINFTVTKRNAQEVQDIFELSEGLGAKAIHFFFLVPTGRGSAEDIISPERQEELLRLIDLERSRRSIEVQVTCAPQFARIARPGRGKRSGGCMAGTSFVFVSRRGDVYPCGYLPVPAGNIREQGFGDIWENSPVLKALRERRLNGKCGECSYLMICGGCRARAFAKNGDYLGSDPICPEAA